MSSLSPLPALDQPANVPAVATHLLFTSTLQPADAGGKPPPSLALSPSRQNLSMHGIDYRKGSALGSGLWADTVRYESLCGKTVAVKSMQKPYEKEHISVMREEIGAYESFFLNLKQVHRSHFMAFHGPASAPDGSLHSVMEEATGGDLDRCSNALNYLALSGDLSRDDKRAAVSALCRDASAGIAAVHAAGFLHLDIKALNFLMHEGRVKVGDFGSMQKLPEDGVHRGEVRVTRELKPRTGEAVTTKFDVHLLGQMFHVLSQDHGYRAEMVKCESDIPGKRKKDDTPFGSLVSRMLDADPKARPEASEVTTDPALATSRPKWLREMLIAVSEFGRDKGAQLEPVLLDLSETDAEEAAPLSNELRRMADFRHPARARVAELLKRVEVDADEGRDLPR